MNLINSLGHLKYRFKFAELKLSTSCCYLVLDKKKSLITGLQYGKAVFKVNSLT